MEKHLVLDIAPELLAGLVARKRLAPQSRVGNRRAVTAKH